MAIVFRHSAADTQESRMSEIRVPVRVFVGTDRSQLLALKVLEYSIRRHTDLPVEVHPMLDLPLPEPKDPRQRKRTGFSFARFAIPQLAGHRGRALYLDPDMQVFKDIRSLWSLPFDGAKVIIQDHIPDEAQEREGKAGAPKERIKQTAVMLLDCDALDWDPVKIIQGLDGEYSYEDLVYQLCILRPDEIRYTIPFEWNSLEFWNENTCLLHYTDMLTQPWVSPANKLGYLWLREVKRMLDEGVMTLAEIQNEIDLGYFRPSLIEELRDPAALEGFDPKRAKAAGGERQGRQLRQAQGGVRGGAAAEAGDPRVRGGGGERGSARDQSQEAERAGQNPYGPQAGSRQRIREEQAHRLRAE
jgi:Glycosyl transferase family 8